jgi:hypothetical protein
MGNLRYRKVDGVAPEVEFDEEGLIKAVADFCATNSITTQAQLNTAITNSTAGTLAQLQGLVRALLKNLIKINP